MDAATLQSFQCAYVFQHEAPVNSIDFLPNGQKMVVSTNNAQIITYDPNDSEPVEKRKFFCKTHGVQNLRLTHAPNTVLTATDPNFDRMGTDAIRYLSLHDNTYLRIFRGHTDKVVDLDVSPVKDTFISASLDETVRFWDIRSPSCEAILRRKGRPSIAYGPQGKVFAFATGVNTILIYNLAELAKGPFNTITVDAPTQLSWAGIKFNNTGKLIVTWSTQGHVFVLNAYSGEAVFQFSLNTESQDIIPALPQSDLEFTPDGRFLLAGHHSGNIQVWDTVTHNKIAEWAGHPGPVHAIKFHPKSMLVAVADLNNTLAYWIPAKPQNTE